MAPKTKKQAILIQSPKGMHDILPEDYELYQKVYEKAEEISEYYGFSPIQTPHLERTELFGASLGETSDIIEKQMYTLRTVGGDHLALRPEGTVGIMRAYLEHGMHTLPQPVMLRYKGSFFRHERPQKGRFREFQQFGLEIINEEKASAEAVVIKILTMTLEELGAGPIIVRINSLGDKDCKAGYRKDLLSYYRKKTSNLCKSCQKRFKTNPLRLLDCKEEGCAEIKKGAPQMINYLCNPCKQHFKEVLEFLDSSGIPYFLDSYLVRGLDYYSRTVFEIFKDNKKKQDQDGETKNEVEETQIALGGGGRYDYLAKMLSRKDFPAIGGGLGVDRVVQLLKEKDAKTKTNKTPKVFFVQLGSAAKHKSLDIMEKFRKTHLPVAQSMGKDSLKGQMKIADKLNVPYALIMGQKEVMEESIIIHDMNSRAQETVSVDKVVEIIKQKIKK